MMVRENNKVEEYGFVDDYILAVNWQV